MKRVGLMSSGAVMLIERESPCSSLWLVLAVCLGGLLTGAVFGSPSLWALSSVAAVTGVFILWQQHGPVRAPKRPAAVLPAALSAEGARRVATPHDTAALVEEMLAQGRYVLLLRPQIAVRLTEEQLGRAMAELEKQMAFIPPAQLCIGLAGKETEPDEDDGNDRSPAEVVVEVEPFRLDRYPVTNRQFAEFVRQGGYAQAALWQPDVWPLVAEFVDQTGQPGPRWWRDGKYPPGEENHPVIGISWYEAQAYARWVGKRLPSDPEWELAGAAPVPVGDGTLVQRRYPWGNSMERQRANVWSSGKNRTVPVGEFAEGASLYGVQQLIGNVWEWTSGDFAAGEYERPGLVASAPMKSIRGGAFDTYFDNQATCQFQSGEKPLARKHNIGFRCAASACDLATTAGSQKPSPATAAAGGA